MMYLVLYSVDYEGIDDEMYLYKTRKEAEVKLKEKRDKETVCSRWYIQEIEVN